MASLCPMLFYIFAVQALGDQACESDFAELLQHPATQFKRPGPCGIRGKPSELAVTFKGGGFKAHSVYSGVVSGLLAALGRNKTSMNMEDNLEKLFHNVSLFASNSGGSWFFSQLVFSPSFASLIEMMAADPSSAGKSFDTTWITPLVDYLPVALPQQKLASLRHTVALPGALGECKDVKFCNNDRWSISRNGSRLSGDGLLGDSILLNFIELLYEVVFLIKPDHDYQDFVNAIFRSTSGIDETVQMGSNVNDFAKHKKWLAAVSLATMGGEGPGTCGTASVLFKQQCLSYHTGWDSTYVFSNESEARPSQSVSYKTHARNPKLLAGWTPARFSIALDSGIDADAAFPICAAGVCDSMQLEYASSGRSAKSPLLRDQATLNKNVGKLPVRDVAGASSAFLGFLISINLWDSGTAQHIGEWFANGISMIIGLPEETKQMMKDWVKNALTSDWAYWMTQNNNAGEAFEEGRTLRKEIQKTNGTVPEALLQELAQKQFMGVVDGGNTDNTAIGQALAGGAEEVVAFSAGTDSLFQLFGGVNTNQGRAVKLYVVNVDTGLGLGGFDYHDYSDLVQEIISTMLSSKNVATSEEVLRRLRALP